MSSDKEIACSFRDSNDEILNLIKFGSYTYEKSTMKAILEDKSVSAKLTKIIDYYSEPTPQSKAKIDKLQWGQYKMTTMTRTFLEHFSSKLCLDEELTFHLLELYFISHSILFNKVITTESEDIKRELHACMKSATTLYYKERITLIKAVTTLVLLSRDDKNLCKDVFLEFIDTHFPNNTLIDKVWQQYTNRCKKEIPQSVHVPHEREEWYIQSLEEEKSFLELLICCNFVFAHPNAENYINYLTTYAEQEFKGGFRKIERDLHFPEYREYQKKIVQEIGDLCVFHLLSSIHIDIFTQRGSIPIQDENRNPYNLVCNKDNLKRINNFFLKLADGKEFITQHLGPVILSWIVLLYWEDTLPNCIFRASGGKIEELEALTPEFPIMDFLQKMTERHPFKGSSLEFSSILKYLLMALISRLHSSASIENFPDYGLVVNLTCACLETNGSFSTLDHFWKYDFQDRNGLFLMLTELSKKYPYSAEEFLHLVIVLIGDKNCSFAKEIVEYLSRLRYFRVTGSEDDMTQPDAQGKRYARYEIASSRITIPKGSSVAEFEYISRDKLLITWEIYYSLWPVLFDYWDNINKQMKQSRNINEREMAICMQYLEILCKIIILTPKLASVLEENGLRQYGNNNFVASSTKPSIPNQIITENLLDTFIEFSRTHSPNLSTLSCVIQAIKCIYKYESVKDINNPITIAFNQIVVDRHGFGSLNSPHPLFTSLSKLKLFERSSENYSVTFSMLKLCRAIFRDDACMRVLPIESMSFISEALKFCLGEVLPDVFNMTGIYRWRNSYQILDFINILLKRYSSFLGKGSVGSPFIELISNQLNKVAIAGFIDTVLHVVTEQNEYSDIQFYNIHISQCEEIEELGLIKTMISSALSVLQELLDILLYVVQHDRESFFIQAASDVFRLICTQSSNNELPLVSALMSYVPVFLKKPAIESREKENIPAMALQCLTKIVLIWEKAKQKNSLDHYLSGPCQNIKQDFIEIFEQCFTDSRQVSSFLKYDANIAFLEFIIVSIPTQKNFINSMLGSFDLSRELGKNFQEFSTFEKAEIDHESLVTYFHYLILYEKIMQQGCESIEARSNLEIKAIPGLAGKFLESPNLFSSAVEAMQNFATGKPDPQGFDTCIFIHSYASIFRILTSITYLKLHPERIKLVLNEDFLHTFFSLSHKILTSESTMIKLHQTDSNLIRSGLSMGIEEFAVLQSHNEHYWKIFECNPKQYGSVFKYDVKKMIILLSGVEELCSMIEETSQTMSQASTESSLIDSQNIALNSFKEFFAYISSFGFSGKINSALHFEVPKSEIKSLLLSDKKIANENIHEAIVIIKTIAQNTWYRIRSERNFKNKEVLACINVNFEILLYCYNYMIHMISTKIHQRSEETEVNKVKFIKLSEEILAGLVDFFPSIKHPSNEMMSFCNLFLSYYAKYYGFESKPKDYMYVFVSHLSKFICNGTQNIVLVVSCLEYVLELSSKLEYAGIFKPLACNRVLLEKLTDENASELECLSIIKYFVSLCKTQSGAKFVLSLRLFNYLLSMPCLKGLTSEYNGDARDSKHVIWCWLLVLVDQISEVLVSDMISMAQVVSFLSEFNWRISLVLQFNYISDGKSNGEILFQKQFSTAYLEELEILLCIMGRLVECYDSLKKADKEKTDYWINLIAAHTIRIFHSHTEIIHTFPPMTDHERSMNTFMVQDAGFTDKTSEPKRIRSIYGSSVREVNEVRIVKPSKISIFNYRVHSLLLYILEDILGIFINFYQTTRHLPFVELYNLIGASKFLVSNYALVANNSTPFANFDKLATESYRNPDITSLSGGIALRYEFSSQNFLLSCKKCFEILFYVVLKLDINRNAEAKQTFSNLANEWVKVTNAETIKGEPKDLYLSYILDQIST